MVAPVDFLEALGPEITFRDHLHLQLCGLDRISVSDHGSEHTVAGEIGVHSDQQVAHINRVGDTAVGRHDGLEEALHLLYGVCHEYRLEVVALLQSVAYTCANGIYILKHGAVFDALDVGADRGLHVLSCKDGRHHSTVHRASAPDGEIAETLERHLLRMRRSADARDLLFRHVERVMEILRDGDVVVGHNTFSGNHNHLVSQAGLQLFEVSLEIRRGRDEDECVAVFHDVVDVGVERDPVDVELHAREVSRVMFQTLEVVNTVFAPEIPVDILDVDHDDLGNGSGPAAASDNRHSSTILKFQDSYFFSRRKKQR